MNKCKETCPFRLENGFCLLYSRKLEEYCFNDEKRDFEPQKLPECTPESKIEDLFK